MERIPQIQTPVTVLTPDTPIVRRDVFILEGAAGYR